MVGLRAILAYDRDARFSATLTNRTWNESGFVALRQMRVPGAPGLRLDVREAGARRRVGDSDEVIAGGTLDLPPGELWFALQRLVAVRAVKLEFGCVHKLHPHHAPTGGKKYMKDLWDYPVDEQSW